MKFRIQNFYSWADIFNNKRRSDNFPLDDWLYWLYYNDSHRDIQVLLMNDFQCVLFVMLWGVAFNIMPVKTATTKKTRFFHTVLQNRKFWGNKRNHLKLNRHRTFFFTVKPCLVFIFSLRPNRKKRTKAVVLSVGKC